jgi:clan AA aspartic protease (TIGR02281 family)
MQQPDFTTCLGGGAAAPFAARALQPRIWRIRVLTGLTVDDRVARTRKICAWGSRGRAHLVSLMLLSIAAAITTSQTAKAVDVDDLSAAMERLQIGIPMSVAGRDPVRRHLEELNRESCDQRAIADLGKALDDAGYRREAANAHVRFSQTCGGQPASLRAAVNILLKLSDYPHTVSVATDLIKLEPYSDNGFFLRAVAHQRAGSYQRAIDDYVTAIELFGNKDRISSVSYLGIARSYEKLDRFCDAVVPLQSWISLNPARNDTSQVRVIIDDYMKKGNCSLATGTEETFPVPRQGRPITLQVAINGQRGVFILDTGATFVALKRAFATKASVIVDAGSAVRLHTANGIADGKLGRAATIQLRSLQARDVPIVVEDDDKAAFGDGVDGLLGMSFLSRFKITIDTRLVKLSNRQTK